jgi:stage II sporulation protein D
MAIGHDRVKSTNFQLSKTSDGRFELVGQGYGHGVGMCQWGARHLAVKGLAYREILKHYYPRATLSLGAGTAVVAGLKQPEKL